MKKTKLDRDLAEAHKQVKRWFMKRDKLILRVIKRDSKKCKKVSEPPDDFGKMN